MNKVTVEYVNKDKLGILSSHVSEPIKAVVTVYASSFDPNGKNDIVSKDYHLYVGQAVSFEDASLSDEQTEAFKQSGVVQFVKNELGVIPVYSHDAVFADSDSLESRLGSMLAHLDALGYETPGINRDFSRK